jgi:hypothetical protein
LALLAALQAQDDFAAYAPRSSKDLVTRTFPADWTSGPQVHWSCAIRPSKFPFFVELVIASERTRQSKS